MSAFSDYINKIRENRNMRIIDFARACNFDTSTVSRWCSGQRFPASDDIIDIISNRLMLSYAEKQQLEITYMQTAFGKRKYRNYSIVEDMIAFMYKECCSLVSTKQIPSFHPSFPQEKPAFRHSSSQSATLIHMLNIFSETPSEETLYIKLDEPSPNVLSVITNHILLSGSKKIELLFCISQIDFFQSKLASTLLKTIFEVVLHCDDVTVFMFEQSTDTPLKKENWILTRRQMLQFDDEIQESIFTNYPEWIHDQWVTYEHMRRDAKNLGHKLLSVGNYIDNATKAPKIYTYEYMPCMTINMDKELIDQHIYPNIPNREQLISSIVNNYNLTEDSGVSLHIISSEEGLRTFMETGILSVFPYPIYQPFSMEERIMLVQKLLDSMDQDIYKQHFHKRTIIDNFPMFELEYYEEKENSFVNIKVIHKDFQTHSLVFNHPGIIQCVKDYFEVIKHPRFSYSEEQTRQIMEEIIQEYSSRL